MDRFLRLSEVLKIFPISKSTLWLEIKEGRFPAPVRLTERTVAWLESDLAAHRDKLTQKVEG